MRLAKFVKDNFLLCFGVVLILLLLFVTFVGPYLPLIDQELEEVQYLWTEDDIPIPPPFEPSNENYLIGSDHAGRDLLSLLVMGAKETLLVVILITLVRYIIAIPLAFFAHKKWLGTHLMLNWLNGFLSYIPTILMVLLIVMLPPFLFTEFRPVYLVLIIALVEVGRAADAVKLELDEISSKEYILSGVVAGAGSFRLFKYYFLPFIYGKLIVYMITDLGKVMFLIGQLAFIGVFVSQYLIQVDAGQFAIRNSSISWPMLLMNATRDIRMAIWIPFWSAFAMAFTIFSLNILAQGIQNLFKKRNTYI
ncbi:peptide ABC transporter permease [Filobacillus milosensis]|uniref:Peptide ABC transporter permease n=1 Tax=Filobacillus milosensis TaxID=94137 RepID=A0A4Y8IGR5_9BACI|nr:peptide ABC transporter permease [Filobacillus milosensis]TFB14637.1 peptide ABC transporter permease [Filobacillus milosensis]